VLIFEFIIREDVSETLEISIQKSLSCESWILLSALQNSSS
jgi:hypothetical protein